MTMEQIVIRCLCVYFYISMSVAVHIRPKRLIGGSDLPDHKLYNTQFVVSLTQTFLCASEQFDHKFLDCAYNHMCGGSIITADFVLTACHCLVFEDWYSNPPPVRKNLTLGDLPPYIDDRIYKKPRKPGDPLVHRKEIRVDHTLSTDYTVFAGDPSRMKTPQRRHSAKLFVHHLCTYREEVEFEELWADSYGELDIGLVKTCFPFRLNKDVQLAPLRPKNHIDEHLHRMLHMSATCLFVGWGYALVDNTKEITEGFISIVPDMLQHAFRSVGCGRECTFDRHNCFICSRHHGVKLSSMRSGDSGSPMICDGYLTAVHARGLEGWDLIQRNFTMGKHIAVACVKDFISEVHLSHLRSLTHNQFHYVNGEPIDGTFP